MAPNTRNKRQLAFPPSGDAVSGKVKKVARTVKDVSVAKELRQTRTSATSKQYTGFIKKFWVYLGGDVNLFDADSIMVQKDEFTDMNIAGFLISLGEIIGFDC